MDVNYFLGIDYDAYTISCIIDHYLDKVMQFTYYKDLQDMTEEIKDVIKPQLQKELEELYEGKGLNTKTKKSDLYSILENKLNKIYEIIDSPVKQLILLETSIRNLQKDGYPEDKDIQRYELLGLNKVTITMAIKLKLFARYEKLLPKKRTSTFKENYPLLNSCYQVYEGYKANKEAEEKFITVHNNNGISEKVQNLHLNKFKDEHVEQFRKYGRVDVKLQTSKGFIKLDVDTGDGVNIFDVANEVNSIIGATQSQLIVYIMSLVFEQNKPEDVKKGCMVDIDVRKYCELKGIEFKSRVGDAIHEDIKKLEKIIIEYEYINEKGKPDHLRESPLVMNTGIIDSYSEDGKTLEKQVVGVALGKWIETLSYSQFQYINKAFFKYKLRNQSGTIIPISYYINCKHRNDYHNSKNRNGNFELKVHRLTSKLDISEDTIKNQGYKKKLKGSLEKTLNNIKEAEGFDWCYKNGTHNSREEFENDVIIFNNTTLNNLYRKKGFERKGNIKSKKR